MKTENKKLMVNIFESRKAMLKFSEASNFLGANYGRNEKGALTAAMLNLFDAKSVSEEGEFDSFKITESDIDTALSGICMKANLEVEANLA